MTFRTIVIGALALLFGGSAAIGVNLLYKQRAGAPPEGTAAMVVAVKDVSRGAVLTADDLQVRQVPEDLVPEGAITEVENAVGRVAFHSLVKGEPVLDGMVSAKNARGGLAGLIPKGMRAFTIQTPHVATQVAGFILPGNRVDVLLTTNSANANDSTGGAATTTLLQNVEILAVDQRLDAPSENRMDMHQLQSVTLLVTPNDAAKLDLGQNKGTLHLSLRNPGDSLAAQTRAATLSGLQFSPDKPWAGQMLDSFGKMMASAKAKKAAVQSPIAANLPPPLMEIRTLRGTFSGIVEIEPVGGGERLTGKQGKGTAMRFAIISDNQGANAQVKDSLAEYGHECVIVPASPANAAINHLRRDEAEVLIVVLSPNPEPGLAVLEAPRTGKLQRVLAVGPVADAGVRLGALGGGADQFLDEAQLKLELEAVLKRMVQQTPLPSENGRVISVLAPSGGSGSSTLAANLATALAEEYKRCLLLDLNLGAGDLASLLDLKPAYTLADLCRNSTRMDRAIFERCLVRHPRGVSLLSPSRSFADISQVTSQGVQDVLALARGLFPYVVADLDDSFHSEQTQVLKQSDVILLVLRLDFTSLRNTQRTLDHLTQMQIHRDRVRVVVNRYGQAKELPAAKAEEALGVRISHYIPDDPKTINRANNHGVPAVLDAPSAKVSKSLYQLATSVNGRKTS